MITCAHTSQCEWNVFFPQKHADTWANTSLSWVKWFGTCLFTDCRTYPPFITFHHHNIFTAYPEDSCRFLDWIVTLNGWKEKPFISTQHFEFDRKLRLLCWRQFSSCAQVTLSRALLDVLLWRKQWSMNRAITESKQWKLALYAIT